MGFWDTVNRGLKRAAREGWTAVKKGAKAGRLKYRIYKLHSRAEKRFAEIGGIVYDMAKPPFENPLSRPDVQGFIEELKRIESETARLESELAELKKREGR